MALPPSLSRLQGIRDFVDWRKAVETLLAELDARLASRHLSQAGIASVWVGAGQPPSGHLLANGQTVARVTHQELHAALGSPGGPNAATFVVPNLGAPAGGGVWVVRG